MSVHAFEPRAARAEAPANNPPEPGPAAAAVTAARQAQPRWAATPVGDRLAVVRRLRRALAADAAALAARVGRPDAAGRAETLAAELLPVADACRFLEREAGRVLAPRALGADGRPAWLGGVELEVRREPHGVVLVVGPANYPLLLPGVQAIQALAAGNAAVWKPGRGGFAVARRVAALAEGAGLDPALLPVLPEGDEAAREAIAAGVDKVVLTGSAATGAAVLAELAPRRVPATMELSGCDAVFVRADADPARTAAALTFGLRLNGGATCIAPRRVFVAAARASALEAELAAAAAALPPAAVDAATAARVAELAGAALAAGARPVAGWPPRSPEVGPGELPGEEAGEGQDQVPLAPLVLAAVPRDARLLAADLFAPVLALVAVAGDEDALAAAAACPFALGASVFGRDEAAARALAARVRAGVVVVNDLIVPTADPRLPFGGRGASGFGVTRGEEGLLEMTAVKAIAIRRGGGRLRHLEPPHPGDEALFRAYLAVAHGGFRRRLRGAVDLTRALAARIRDEIGRREPR